jgi:hypothetical protein
MFWMLEEGKKKKEVRRRIDRKAFVFYPLSFILILFSARRKIASSGN